MSYDRHLARRYLYGSAHNGPDGMRAANGKLIVAGNGSGKISVITEPAGGTIWIAERGARQGRLDSHAKIAEMTQTAGKQQGEK